jgi:hypothetical protein
MLLEIGLHELTARKRVLPHKANGPSRRTKLSTFYDSGMLIVG